MSDQDEFLKWPSWEDRQSYTSPNTPAMTPNAGYEAWLVVIAGMHLGRRYALPRSGNAVVGRSHNADIHIAHDSISRRHAEFLCGADQFKVRDLGSTNGTYVNDQQIHTTATLQDGDQIQIGKNLFKLLHRRHLDDAYSDEIYRLTTHDSLTGLYNKRYFTELLEREMRRGLRYNRVFSLIMLDIARFKRVNVAYGYLTGDLILRQFSHRLRSIVRKEDVLVRYGDDEFVVLLPECNRSVASKTADRIQDLMVDEPFYFNATRIELNIRTAALDLNTYIESLHPQALPHHTRNPVPAMLLEMLEDALENPKEPPTLDYGS